MSQIATIALGLLGTFFVAIVMFLLKSIFDRLSELTVKLDDMGKGWSARIDKLSDAAVDEATCRERREACSEVVQARELWSIFNTHSHTGLEPSSSVIRKPG